MQRIAIHAHAKLLELSVHAPAAPCVRERVRNPARAHPSQPPPHQAHRKSPCSCFNLSMGAFRSMPGSGRAISNNARTACFLEMNCCLSDSRSTCAHAASCACYSGSAPRVSSYATYQHVLHKLRLSWLVLQRR